MLTIYTTLLLSSHGTTVTHYRETNEEKHAHVHMNRPPFSAALSTRYLRLNIRPTANQRLLHRTQCHKTTGRDRCSSTYIPSNTETPFRARKGMKMAPPATTTYPRADVSAVTPTPSRNPKRSLVLNDGMSKRELKRSRGESMCLRHPCFCWARINASRLNVYIGMV